MKKFLLCLLLFAHGVTGAHGFRFDGDEVYFNKEEAESMDLLSERLSRYFSSAEEQIPESLKAEILKLKSPKFYELPLESQELFRVHIELAASSDPEVSKSIIDVWKWSGLKVGDAADIKWLAFYAHLHKQDYDISESVADSMIMWREATPPEVRFSPDGRGEIKWIWLLESSKKRQNGTLHVGIDLKKRTFICYESDLGLYFPEGEVMERIYREIVQEPEMAGIWLGKGFKKEKEKEEKEEKE